MTIKMINYNDNRINNENIDKYNNRNNSNIEAILYKYIFLYSGKTLVYALPIIQILQTRFVRVIRCLIVLPVQELAQQVFRVIKQYSKHTCLKVTLVSGTSTFEEEQEKLVQTSMVLIILQFMSISLIY